MNPVLISFAFLAGLQAFFTPCSIALLPAYVGYYVREESGAVSRTQQLLFGLRAGAIASAGLLSIYISFGILLALFGKLVAPFIIWIELVTGAFLLFLGCAVLLGYTFALTPPVNIRAQAHGAKRFYLFGVAYALGAIGCTLPIFLVVLFQAVAQGGPLGGFVNFVSYATAITSLLLTFSLVAAVSKTAMQRFLQKYMGQIQKSAGILILFAGIYLIYLALKVITV